MIGFGLLCGHMIGDYIVQNDWMAANKSAWAAKHPPPDAEEWDGPAERERTLDGHLACTVHCLLYTLSVWACSFWWMPWWGLLACFLIHWPIDRFRLAVWWMNNVSGQKFFASKEHPMWPNSIILVDNTFHLVTLLIIAVLALGV